MGPSPVSLGSFVTSSIRLQKKVYAAFFVTSSLQQYIEEAPKKKKEKPKKKDVKINKGFGSSRA